MKIESDSLIAEVKNAKALMRANRESEVSVEGRAAANLIFQAVSLAKTMRAFMSKDYEGQAKLWDLIQGCVEGGEDSELNRILAEMQK